MILDSLLVGVMLFSSFAMRSPNQKPNPDDYELSIGLSHSNFFINRQWERELGGKYVDDFEEQYKTKYEIGNCISCANGTDAIYISLKALGIGPGDGVVLPSLTFWASAAAILHHNAIPNLC